jgi:hypothetical protein
VIFDHPYNAEYLRRSTLGCQYRQRARISQFGVALAAPGNWRFGPAAAAEAAKQTVGSPDAASGGWRYQSIACRLCICVDSPRG